MAAAQGVFTQLGIDSSNPVTKRFDFHSESLRRIGQLLDTNGLRGTREKKIERVRSNFYRVAGGLSFQPNAVELSLLLPWIFGQAASGTTYSLSDSLATRYVTIDRISKVMTYAGCGVNRATFRASQGEPLSLDLDVIGQTETVGNAGTFPSLSIDTATGPFIFTDLVLTVGGSTYNARDFEIVLDNQIDAERFFNSATLVSVATRGRSIMFRTNLPYGDAAAVYAAGESGVAVVGTFTNGAVSCAFSLPSVAFPTVSPNIPGRVEIMVPIEGEAYHVSSSDSMTVTLDSTP